MLQAIEQRFAFRAARRADHTVIQDLWEASQGVDDPAFRPRTGWWSLADWAIHAQLLVADVPIGVVAINVAADGAAELRLALLPERRTHHAAEQLVAAAVQLARPHGRALVRLYLPSAATWAAEAADRYGFTLARSYHAMLRSAAEPLHVAPMLDEIAIRRLRRGEEPALLTALNHAWSGTWNFRPLLLEELKRDLDGQHVGFLVAAPRTNARQIVGTVHAIFDPGAQNPDGSPYAWISNLTTNAGWRGKGLGRALLTAGITALQVQGAQSVAIGVDGGNPVPLALYRSLGFATFRRLDVWEAHEVQRAPSANQPIRQLAGV